MSLSMSCSVTVPLNPPVSFPTCSSVNPYGFLPPRLSIPPPEYLSSPPAPDASPITSANGSSCLVSSS